MEKAPYYVSKNQQGEHCVWERKEDEGTQRVSEKLCTCTDGEKGEAQATYIAAALNYVDRNGINC